VNFSLRQLKILSTSRKCSSSKFPSRFLFSGVFFYAIIQAMQKGLNTVLIFFICASFVFTPSFSIYAQTNADLEDVNKKIETKKKHIADLKKKTETYKKNIQQKQQEAISLKNQLATLDNSIEKNKIDIQITAEIIEKTKLEIRDTEIQIVLKEEESQKKKGKLKTLLRELHKQDQAGMVNIIFGYDTVADFFQEVEYLKNIQSELDSALDQLKILQKALEIKQEELEAKDAELQQLKEDLDLEKDYLGQQIDYKDNLLAQTNASEQKFYTLYWKAKQEQNQANTEIYNLEKKARKLLKELKEDKPQLTDASISWPLTQRRITAYFHDPTYPFRHIFEHPGIDIAAPQGTSIGAAAEGYVIKAKDAGMGYSYIAIIHASKISTVYGHVSKIFVKEDDYVSKGEVIGLIGGIPGTPGAGYLSTGAHLHFEVRSNGIPVNPLNYLPVDW